MLKKGLFCHIMQIERRKNTAETPLVRENWLALKARFFLKKKWAFDKVKVYLITRYVSLVLPHLSLKRLEPELKQGQGSANLERIVCHQKCFCPSSSTVWTLTLFARKLKCPKQTSLRCNREEISLKKKNLKKYIEQPQNNSHIIYSCQQQVADNHKVGTKVQRQVGPEDREK